MLKLADQKEAEQFIKSRIDSREWWIIVGASEGGTSLAQAVESEFYSGDKSEFFDMVMLPAVSGGMPLISAIFFARKSDMTPAQLASLMDTVGGKPANEVEIDETRDVIIVHDTPVGFLEWLARTFN